MKYLVLIQARMSSTRFPEKVIEDINGTPMIEFMYNRVKKAKRVTAVAVITSVDSSDDRLFEFCTNKNIKCYRGSLEDVLDRYYQTAIKFGAENVVRLTGDCPLVDYDLLDKIIEKHEREDNDYTSNIEPPTYPDGFDIEVMKFSALKSAWEKSTEVAHREHVTMFIRNSSQYKKSCLKCEEDLSGYRITVDYPSDLEVVEEVVQNIEEGQLTAKKICDFLEASKAKEKNSSFVRNEGMKKSILESVDEKRKMVNERYKKSTEFLKEAEDYIPLGSQTFSKSRTQMPVGAAPLFIDRADGSRVTDIDGNEYIDFVSSLLCINLGYNYPAVKDAVAEQLEIGTIFSLSSSLETEVARLLTEVVPCAESVRFGKNGTDVTSAAVRLSRSYTGKNLVITCGYHGWQDWYIGITSKNAGVPDEVRRLTKKFNYNDIGSLKEIVEENRGQIACLIMEPMNVDFPKDGFLEEVREICTREKIILIFDEMITGFRFSIGGAQELFGVTPDLACFGKGMANGYPISAIVGKKDMMKGMEDIFFSGTFGGELLSLRAAKTTIEELIKEDALSKIKSKGEMLYSQLKSLIAEYKFEEYFDIKGYPSWTFFIIKESDAYQIWELKTLFIQEMLLNGICTFGTHNLNYSHSNKDIEELILSYKAFFNIFKEVMDLKISVKDLLCCDPLKPLFTVRGN